jgi:hypothetical protein
MHGDAQASEIVLGLAREMAVADPLAWADLDVSEDGISARVTERQRREDQDEAEIIAMTPGVSAEIAGGMAGMLLDVRQIPFLLLGGGGGSFLRVMGREALLNAAAEGVTLPSQFESAERLDKPDPDVLRHLMFAAGAGAVFGGAVEAGSRAIRYYFGRSAVKPLPGFDEQASEVIITAAEDALVKGYDPITAAGRVAEQVTPEPPRLIPEETRAPTVEERETAIADAEAQLDADFPEMRAKYPLAQLIRRLGGIKSKRKNLATGDMEPTFAASELAAMGITPKTHPFMFNNKTGHGDLDNIVASEHPGLAEVLGVEGDYLSRDALVSALGRELAGGPKTPMSAEIAARMREIDAIGRTSPAEDFVAGKEADGGFFVNPDLYDFLPDGDAVLAQHFDEYLAEKWAGVRFTDAERRAMLRELSTRGGDAEYLVLRILERERDFAELPRVEAERYDLPPWDDDPVSGLSDARREGAGGPRQDAAPARGGAAGEGRDPFPQQDGQFLIQGTDRAQTGVAQAQAAEIAARQQQSKLRRLDQTRVENDATGLFGDAQRDMFDDPTAPEAQALMDSMIRDIEDEVADDDIPLSFDGDRGPVGLTTDDGRPIASVRELLDEIRDYDAAAREIAACRTGGANDPV